MGMGMGFAMANQMGQAFTGGQQQQPQANQSQTPTPPPIPPTLTFFVVVNGQQAGPYDLNTLKQMAMQNQINRDVLVWREGMVNWQAAGQVNELNSVFGSVPPPIPGQ
jgi:hypothetical protein